MTGNSPVCRKKWQKVIEMQGAEVYNLLAECTQITF